MAKYRHYEYETELYDLDKIPMEWKFKSGLYALINMSTGQRYIGSSVDVKKRILAHKTYHSKDSLLTRQTKLYTDMRKFKFKAAIIKFTEDYLQAEEAYINKHFKLLYNKRPVNMPPVLTDKYISKFHTKYIKVESGCWETTLVRSGCGYAYLRINSIKYLMHKLSYFIHNGEWPGNLMVRHLCNNKKCCNPDHLELGTPRDNWNDRKQAGLKNIGCRGLTIDVVNEIREKYLTGKYSHITLWQEYKDYVDLSAISAIVSNNSWHDPSYTCPKFKRNGGGKRLSNQSVLEIRKLYAEGWTKSKLSMRFKSDHGSIRDIVNNRSYKKVGVQAKEA